MGIEFPISPEEAEILGQLFDQLHVKSAKELLFKIPELVAKINAFEQVIIAL